ncbi:hypothetical protein EYF80_046004 [Liparis tanakae]|uniref:Uncharacterized protein n=1 Tax=Liparis tanakae TaxID=230148 RepID=A0A4Z2FRC1_9TELE|nr:hypothetical protein EYF80_046004 [Liparis tanakae]
MVITSICIRRREPVIKSSARNSALFLAHSTSPNSVWSAILHMMLKVLRRSCFPRLACSLCRLARTLAHSWPSSCSPSRR